MNLKNIYKKKKKREEEGNDYGQVWTHQAWAKAENKKIDSNLGWSHLYWENQLVPKLSTTGSTHCCIFQNIRTTITCNLLNNMLNHNFYTNLSTSKRVKPAICRMNIPWWRVNQCKVGYLNLIRVQKLNQIWSSQFQFFLVEFVPPNCTLAINCTIVA